MLTCMAFEGVDREWVQARLTKYIAETEPKNGSRRGYITSTSYATCGRPRAIELSETVIPILNKLYPAWRSENPKRETFEFASERDAAQRLLARLHTQDEVDARLGGFDNAPRLSASEFHHVVWGAASTQWELSNYHDAVLDACKIVNSYLQKKVMRDDVSERDLVKQAFSDRAPEQGKRRLRMNSIPDEQTTKSVQSGVLEFGSGCFGAIRNPLGHRPKDDLPLTEQEALERLAALSLFLRWVDEATLEDAAPSPA